MMGSLLTRSGHEHLTPKGSCKPIESDITSDPEH